MMLLLKAHSSTYSTAYYNIQALAELTEDSNNDNQQGGNRVRACHFAQTLKCDLTLCLLMMVWFGLCSICQ